MTPLIAVIDACVLYSAILRDLMMRLGTAGLFHPRWTERIHDEWIENLLIRRSDLNRERLERTRALMNLHAEGSLVDGYEALIPMLDLPDPGDRHVLAAAIIARADVIITFNLTDFPDSILSAFGIKAEHPDRFASRLFDEETDRFMKAFFGLVAALRNPPRSPREISESLRNRGLSETARRILSRL